MSLEDDLLRQRIERTHQIEALGFRPYGQRFDFSHTVPDVIAAYSASTAEQLTETRINVRLSGRMMTVRRMGKAGFAHLQQNGERIQVYVRKEIGRASCRERV